jgi:hypothetical protein
MKVSLHVPVGKGSTEEFAERFATQLRDHGHVVDVTTAMARGLVLVKSWLLALPHLLIVGVFTATWTLGGNNDDARFVLSGGLLGLVVVIAAIALCFTGRYPAGLFDLVMGINRWLYRVIAYVALMTDEYPPFRLDQGGHEPVTTLPPPVVDPVPAEEQR